MSADKLVDSTQLDSDLTSVANAIRTKGGTSAQLAFPQGFVDAVDAIQTGGSGDYVAADWLNLQKPSGNIVSSAVQSRYGDAYVMAHRKKIDNVFMSDTTIIADSAFYDCYLKKFVGPKVTTVYTAFKTCIYMTHFDILGGTFAASAFADCTKLATVVLRKTAAVVPLSNINVFSNTPFASGKAGGTLYVPQDLIASYQAASNWSTILGYTNNQIKSIESTHTDPNAPIDLTLYYVDGTPLPTA